MNRMRNWISVAALLLITACAGADVRGSGADPRLIEQVDTLLADPALKGGIQGIVVQSPDGKVLYERNADTLLMPASNQKLLVSAAILDALGPDWKFETVIARVGTLDDDGTLHGSLVLKGAGDPLLSTADIDAMVQQIRAAGIKKVQGKVIGDDSRLDHNWIGRGWAWDDLSSGYAAPVGAINLNENQLTLTIDAGRRPGDPVRVAVAPTDKYAKVLNRARTVESGGRLSLVVRRELGSTEVTIDGGIPAGAQAAGRTVQVAVENPSRFALTYLSDKLAAESIVVTGGFEPGIAPRSSDTEVARHTSIPLSELLQRLNKPSDNLIAESLLKTLGAERGKGGTTSEGIRIVLGWLKSIGVDESSVQMADGSGLSRYNYVTARTIAAILKAMATHKQGKVWLDSLPIAGVDGTLQSRLKGSLAENNCRAKTGTMTNVCSLSGYVTGRDSKQLIFSILMNNHSAEREPVRAVQDKIVSLLAGWESKP